MSYNYSPQIVTDGLIYYVDVANPASYVSGSYVSGSLLRDMTGHGYVSTPTAGATGSIGYTSECGGAVTLDGATITSTSYISVSPTITFEEASPRTLEFVCQRVSAGANTVTSLCGRGSSAEWCTWDRVSDTSIRGRFRDSGSVYYYTAIKIVSDFRNWNHIVWTFDENKVWTSYHNGELLSVNSTLTTTYQRIARIAGGYASVPNYYSWNGNWASTKFYNRVLNADEVYQNFSAIQSRFGI